MAEMQNLFGISTFLVVLVIWLSTAERPPQTPASELVAGYSEECLNLERSPYRDWGHPLPSGPHSDHKRGSSCPFSQNTNLGFTSLNRLLASWQEWPCRLRNWTTIPNGLTCITRWVMHAWNSNSLWRPLPWTSLWALLTDIVSAPVPFISFLEST